jgi:hypothetical protein
MEPQPVRERAIKASKKARKAGRRRNFVEFISEVYWIIDFRLRGVSMFAIFPHGLLCVN